MIGRAGGGGAAAPAVPALVLAAVAAALGGGCDECEYGQVICRDNEIWSCANSAPLEWKRMPCGDKVCQVVSSPGAESKGLCSVEAAAHPACAMPAVRDLTCADGRVVACNGGFITDVLQTCAAPDLCVTSPIPFCALSLAPDPRCAAAASDRAAAYKLITVCGGGHLLSCAYPSQLVAEDTDCGGEDLCYTGPPSPGPSPSLPGATPNPTCVVSRTPDPRCADTMSTAYAERISQLCDQAPRQDTLVNCLDGLLTSTRDCGAGGCVHQQGYAYAECRNDSGTDAGRGGL